VSARVLDGGLNWIRQAFEEGVARGKVDAAVKERALAGITTANSVQDAIRDADLIIEAVPEEMEMKMELFTVFDKFAKPGAIFASNTSSLSISEMSELTVLRERCIGMHFFNPVPKMKLIELVKTPFTSEETVATCSEVGRRMGKEVVVVQESPGFITSRINALIGNEAFAMLEAGVASARDIDKALKLGLNHPMGPFEMIDLVGLDVRLSILEYLHSTLGEKYRPNALLKKYVAEGRLGRKSGRGVYDYEERGDAKV
jgi:3-hydroxybutyryl-CoA dehydrogenase